MDRSRPTREDVEREVAELRRRLAELTAQQKIHAQAMDDLRANSDRFRDLVESTSDWVWEVDREGRYTYVSPRVRDLLGREPDDLVGTMLFDIMLPAEAERVAAIFQRCVSRREPFEHIENVCLHVDGREVVMETSGVPVDGPDGNLRGYRGVDRDVTGRRRAEEQRERARRFMQMIVDGIPEYLVVINRDHTIALANRKAREMAGEEDPVGDCLACHHVLHNSETPCDGPEAQCPLAQVVATKAPVIVEHVHYDADGLAEHVEVAAAPIFDESGQVVQVIESCRDITERRRGEIERETTIDLLALLNAKSGLHELMRKVLCFMQEVSGCDAVGIRLRDGDDFPYYATAGFSDDFLETENHLCVRDLNDQLHRDEIGNPILECMCGNIICGRFDPSKSFFSDHGSFVSNCTTELLASTTEADRQSHTRNQCNARGYESVFLAPLRAGGETFGLIQFNDRRRGCFSDDFVAMAERLADSVAIALNQRKSEQALRTSEEHFRDLVTNSISGVALHEMVFDEDGAPVDYIFLQVNPAFEEHTGLRAEDVLGKRVTEVHPGIEETDLIERYGRVAMTGEPARFETFFEPSQRHYSVTAYQVGQGRFAAVFEDITERKQVDEDLQSARLLSEEYIDSLPGLFYVFDEHRFIKWNSEWNRITGYTDEELAERYGTDFFEGEDRALIEERMLEVFREGTSDAEAELVTKDGRRIPYLFTGIRKELNGKDCLVGMGMDITNRHQLEEQLRQSQKMEAIGQLAGGVAHDFNNILTAIQGNAELLKMGVSEPAERVECVDEVIKGAKRAAGLTRQLLAFARKGKWQIVPVDIHDAIAQTVSMLTPTIDRRIKVRMELDASSSVVMGDEIQLHSALVNLGVNARDAMADGGVLTYATRNVTLTEDDCGESTYDLTPGEFLEVCITDTGAGMDETTQKRIFEPFFTTKGVGKGTGLGLAGVYGCVRNLNGRVGVSSKPGLGTTFMILLPLAPADVEATGQAPPRNELVKGTGHILIVDDEESVRNLVRICLESMGYTVSMCADGAAGLDYYREHHREIDLVILDLIMPKMSGQDTFREMKKVNPNVKVLVSSGFSHTHAVGHILDDGALVLLNKPFELTELSRVVAEHIQ